MCHYCGCRQIPLLRDYIAEHEIVTDLAGDVVRAIDRNDLETARRCIKEMAAALSSHWQGEENGLFRVMAREQEFAEHITPLVSEHRELAGFLATVDVADPADQQRVRVMAADLLEHISKEEDGLFPAALTALNGQDWDDSMAAWHEAHPGSTMIAD